MDENRKEYNEGQQAFKDGKPQSANPYSADTHRVQRIDWSFGWMLAKMDADAARMTVEPAP